MAEMGTSTAAATFESTTANDYTTSGVVSFTGSTNVSNMTATMATVDTLTLAQGAGAAALFTTKGGDEYLFMQSGTAGTDDASLIKLEGLTVVQVDIAKSAVKLTHSFA